MSTQHDKEDLLSIARDYVTHYAEDVVENALSFLLDEYEPHAANIKFSVTCQNEAGESETYEHHRMMTLLEFEQLCAHEQAAGPSPNSYTPKAEDLSYWRHSDGEEGLYCYVPALSVAGNLNLGANMLDGGFEILLKEDATSILDIIESAEDKKRIIDRWQNKLNALKELHLGSQ